jgi:endonuclease/exonuclease/phosphatase family metal-dependent hydrolase
VVQRQGDVEIGMREGSGGEWSSAVGAGRSADAGGDVREQQGGRGGAVDPPVPDGVAHVIGPEWEEPHPVLLSWRSNVGAPVLANRAPPLDEVPPRVDVLSWNLAIGLARLEEVVALVRRRAATAQAGDAPLVILAQEAYRADATIPSLLRGVHHGGAVRHSPFRGDILEFAAAAGLSVFYAPSMRNGPARSDRGNAILASRALGPSYAFSLPFLRQRRVALASELQGVPGLGFVSTHFENRARLALGFRSAIGFGASRAEQAEALGRRILATEGGDVVLGGDLNTPRGTRDPAYRSLVRAGFQPPAQRVPWRHTFHGFLRLPLDHVLVHVGGGRIRAVEVERIDENPTDRGWRIFGSDHHPLLATVHLNPQGPAQVAGAADT